MNAFVPGINNIIGGGYVQKDGTIALSAAEKIERGRTAIAALDAYKAAKAVGNGSGCKGCLFRVDGKCTVFWLWIY